MDLSFTAEELAFREEARRFFRSGDPAIDPRQGGRG